MIRPLYDNILIREIKPEAKTEAGIIIPENPRATNKRERQGEVISVGEGRIFEDKVIPLKIKKGDRVIFGYNKGVDVQESPNSEKLFMMKEFEILGVIEDDSKNLKDHQKKPLTSEEFDNWI